MDQEERKEIKKVLKEKRKELENILSIFIHSGYSAKWTKIDNLDIKVNILDRRYMNYESNENIYEIIVNNDYKFFIKIVKDGILFVKINETKKDLFCSNNFYNSFNNEYTLSNMEKQLKKRRIQ